MKTTYSEQDYLAERAKTVNSLDKQMKLIRITSETCSACIVMNEIMKRVMPAYPNIEIIDYDRELDEEEAKEINPNGSVPYISINGKEKIGSCTMNELRNFIDNAIK